MCSLENDLELIAEPFLPGSASSWSSDRAGQTRVQKIIFYGTLDFNEREREIPGASALG
jgi:hypothetical protein